MLWRGQGWAGSASLCIPEPSGHQPLALHFLASCPYACRVPHFPLPSLEPAHDWQQASWAAHRVGISAARPWLRGAGQDPPAGGVRPRELPCPLPHCVPPLPSPSSSPSVTHLMPPFSFLGVGEVPGCFCPPHFICSHFLQPRPLSQPHPCLWKESPWGNSMLVAAEAQPGTTGFAAGPGGPW